MLDRFKPPMPLVDSASDLGATALTIARRNVLLCDSASRRPPPILTSTADINLWAKGTDRVWWGSFEYRTGMTTLTIVIRTSPLTGAESLRLTGGVYGAAQPQLATRAIPTGNTTTTWSIDITGRGYTDGQVITLDLWFTNNTTTSGANTGVYSVQAVYVTPVVVPAATWPGVPTWATTFDAARWSQFSRAQTYLAAYFGRLPLMPTYAMLLRSGTHKPEPLIIWSGTLATGPEALRLRIRGGYLNIKNGSERWQLIAGGGEVWTTATATAGQYGAFDDAVNLSALSGAGRVEARLTHLVTTPAQDAPTINSRLSLTTFQLELDQAYSVSLGTVTPGSSWTAAQVQSWLNTASTALGNAYGRIAARPEPLGRAYAYRRRMAKNDVDNAKERVARVQVTSMQRTGKRLKVAGKGVSLAWGPIGVEVRQPIRGSGYKATSEIGDEDVIDTRLPPDYFPTFLPENTHSLLDGERGGVREINLDSIPGLAPGMTYYLLGDVVYAAEYLL